jgi:formylglycine-generating enzyme required for sulfatase activity
MTFGSPLGAENPRPPRLTADDRALIEWIHGRITSTPLPAENSMEAYEGIVPRSGVKYRMVAIPAGEFTRGSPESEPSRKPDEGPPRAVTVGPFWMGACEVTWDEYLPFQEAVGDRFRNGSLKTVAPETQPVDLVSSPTIPYTSMDFGMGLDGYPATSMTTHAALKYCQWLSTQTGHFYRLPTEAEWEYACRAGSRTAYHFGDDTGPLSDYAWYYENSGQGYEEPQYHKVGLKKPNRWGLHDMHGNVMEWVLDQYAPQGYGRPLADALRPWTKVSDSEWGRVVRGGSWNDDPEGLRCAARRASHPRWMASDPQLPKSHWYLTDAKWVGFRLVRPLTVPSPEEMALIWNSGYPEKTPGSDTSPHSTGEK